MWKKLRIWPWPLTLHWSTCTCYMWINLFSTNWTVNSEIKKCWADLLLFMKRSDTKEGRYSVRRVWLKRRVSKVQFILRNKNNLEEKKIMTKSKDNNTLKKSMYDGFSASCTLVFFYNLYVGWVMCLVSCVKLLLFLLNEW